MENYTVKRYSYLPKELLELRERVFLVEQGFVVERDDIDDIAEHIGLYFCDTLVGVCRVYECDGYVVGRIALDKQYRGRGLGGRLLDVAEKIAKDKGATSIRLHAQTRAVEFYQKYGYEAYGEIEYEEWCEHIWMKKALL